MAEVSVILDRFLCWHNGRTVDYELQQVSLGQQNIYTMYLIVREGLEAFI